MSDPPLMPTATAAGRRSSIRWLPCTSRADFPNLPRCCCATGPIHLLRRRYANSMPDDAAGSSMWKDVTAVEHANDFIYPDLANQEAVSLIAAASANCRMS